MSGQLKRKESPGKGLQRVCTLHVRKALTNLREPDQPDAIHEVRKEVKKMRAIFRLARGTLGKKEYRKTAETMRLAGKPLAAARDACVTKKALRLLAGKKALEFQGVESSLEAYFTHSERSFADNDLGSITELILKRVKSQLGGLSLKQVGWNDVRECLEASYTRGREAFQKTVVKPTPENLHDWRKRVKDLWYQLDFLSPKWPGDSKEMLNSLEELGEELGDDHDLVLLQQFANEHCDSTDETKRLKSLIDAKRGEYGAGIRRLGSRIYSNLPEKVCATLEEDWKSWRDKK